MVVSHAAPTGDLAHNPGMCPDWESNQRPFGFQVRAQSTELYQPGQNLSFLIGQFNELLLEWQQKKQVFKQISVNFDYHEFEVSVI